MKTGRGRCSGQFSLISRWHLKMGFCFSSAKFHSESKFKRGGVRADFCCRSKCRSCSYLRNACWLPKSEALTFTTTTIEKAHTALTIDPNHVTNFQGRTRSWVCVADPRVRNKIHREGCQC